MLTNFKVPLTRGRVGSDYKIKRLVAAFEEGGKAEIYLQIEQCMRKQVKQYLEHLGAGHVLVHSFPRNDRNRLAAKFLQRIIKETSKKTGMALYVREGWLSLEQLQIL